MEDIEIEQNEEEENEELSIEEIESFVSSNYKNNKFSITIENEAKF